MSPSISSNILPNASSVWVRVGKSLLRYMSSICLQSGAMSSAVLHLMKIMPALPETRGAGRPQRARAGSKTALLSASSK